MKEKSVEINVKVYVRVNQIESFDKMEFDRVGLSKDDLVTAVNQFIERREASNLRSIIRSEVYEGLDKLRVPMARYPRTEVK